MAPTRFFKPDKRIQISSKDSSSSGVISLETMMGPSPPPLLLLSPQRQHGRRPRLRRRGAILLFVVGIICSCLCPTGCTNPVSPSQPPIPKTLATHLERPRPNGRDWVRQGGGGSSFFETFMDEQVAVISPLHLGLDIQPASLFARDAAAEGANLSDHLEKLAERVWLAAEGPDGELLRASLIESLQLAQISSKDYERTERSSERGNDDEYDDEGRTPLSSSSSPAHSASGRRYQWRELDEFRKASGDLMANVRDPQLRNLLDVYDMDSFNSNARGRSSPSRGGGAPDERATKEWRRRRAQIEERVTATFNGLDPDEQVRFKMATIEAYSLDKVAASQCEELAQQGEHEPGSRVKRDLTSSSLSSSSSSSSASPAQTGEAGGKVCKTISQGRLILSRLVNRVIEIGMQMFDRLTVTSELLMLMPGLGEKVRDMRAKAEPLIEIVQDLRKTHYLFKVSRCPDSLSQEERDQVCTGHLRHDANSSGESTEINVATEMMTKRGAKILRRLVMFLINDLGLGDKIIQAGSMMLDEITSRASYALLVWVLTSMSS